MNNIINEISKLYPKYTIFFKDKNKYIIYLNNIKIDIININMYEKYINNKRIKHIILDKNNYIVKKVWYNKYGDSNESNTS